MYKHRWIGALALIASVLIGCGDSSKTPDSGADAGVDAAREDSAQPTPDGPAPDARKLWVGFGEPCGQPAKSAHTIRCLDDHTCIFTGEGMGYCSDVCKPEDEGKACTGGTAGELFACVLVDKLNDIYACTYACKRKPSGGSEETFACPAPLSCNHFGQAMGNGDEITLCAP